MSKNRQTDAQWQQLAAANDSGQTPPRTPTHGMTAEPPKGESLTQTFNRAADPRKQLPLLEKKLSQPRATLELGMRGSVTRAYNPGRDRNIAKQIAAIKQSMAKAQKVEAKPQKIELGKPNQLTPKFNQASGMEM